MSSSMDRRNPDCAEIQELVAWLPTATLEAHEKERVENHAAACGACAELLDFSHQLKAGLTTLAAKHPAPDMLVRFSDPSPGRPALGEGVRGEIAAHLALCGACTEEAAILRQVDSGRPEVVEPQGWLVAFGRWLAAGLLRPIPAAVYLLTAVLAIALLISRPARVAAPELEILAGGQRVGGVVLLPDASSSLRGAGAADQSGPILSGAEHQFLLLEFMDLGTVPGPQDRFRISLHRKGTTTPVSEETVAGATFRDNYTLYLRVPAGSLPAGDYAVSVSGPGDSAIFRGPFSVR